MLARSSVPGCDERERVGGASFVSPNSSVADLGASAVLEWGGLGGNDLDSLARDVC